MWKIIIFNCLESVHHPVASVSLVVSVPLPTGVNLPSNTSTASISSHHQIASIKTFANSDSPPVNDCFVLRLVDFISFLNKNLRSLSIVRLFGVRVFYSEPSI